MTPPSQPVLTKRKLSNPIIFVIVLCALLVVGFGAYMLITASKATISGASNAGDQFLTLMKTHDYANAEALLTPIGQQRTPVQSLKNLETLLEENHGSVQSWGNPRWYIENYNGETFVKLDYTVTCSKTATSVDIVVQRLGDSYEVYSFEYQL